MGGSRARGKPHYRLSNVNALCPRCHLRFVEKYPTLAISEGWKVKTGFDPADIPLLMYDGWFFIDDEGARHATDDPRTIHGDAHGVPSG